MKHLIFLLGLVLLLSQQAAAQLDHYYKIPGTSQYFRVPGTYKKFVTLPDGFKCESARFHLEVRVKKYSPVTDYKKRAQLLTALRDKLQLTETRISGSTCEGLLPGGRAYVVYHLPSQAGATHLTLTKLSPPSTDPLDARVYSSTASKPTDPKLVIAPGKVQGEKYRWTEI